MSVIIATHDAQVGFTPMGIILLIRLSCQDCFSRLSSFASTT